jgi:2-phospho-L-lactate guanylyltransferase
LDDTVNDWSVVMPVKPLAAAKSRLAGLSAPVRLDLARAFTQDAIAAALATPAITRVIVVGETDDAPVDPRIHLVPDPTADLTGAIHRGLAIIPADSPASVLVCDIPAVRSEDITAALSHAALHPWSLICDLHGTGTTMLIAHRRRDLQPRFGLRSRAAHVALGATDLTDVVAPGLRCDVDTEVDLWNALRLGVGSHTQTVWAEKSTRER